MRKSVKIGLGIVITSIIFYIIGTLYINNKINNYLSDELLKSKVQVQSVSSNLLMGNLLVKGLKTLKDNKQTSKLATFEVRGFNYYQFLFNNKIVIDHIKANDFQIYFPFDQASTSSSHQRIEIKKILISNGAIFIYNAGVLQSRFHGLQIAADNLNFDTKNVTESLTYQIITVDIDSSFVKLNNYEDIKTNVASVSSQDVEVEDFQIKTNFETTDKINKDQINKDQLNLETAQIKINNYKFNWHPELSFKASHVKIDNADLKVRANNNTEKNKVIKTYSEQLRNAGLKMKIDQIKVNDSRISYSEPNDANTKRGAVTFDSINATCSNFHNIQGKGEFILKTDAVLMGNSAFTTSFSMDPYDYNNTYQWSGNINSFDLSSINSFSNPVLNMRFKGVVNEYYFNVYGNQNSVSADLKIRFDNAQIEFFDKSSISNTVVSGLVNLIATNDTDNELVSKKSSIKRSNKKTFFSQFWAVQRKGLLEVIK